MTTDQTPLLELRDLHTWFPIQRGLLNRTVGQVYAVDGVSLAIQAGETLGLVGESGCGKTTLGRTVIGLEKPTSGTLLLAGLEIGADRTRAQRRRLQMVFQAPFASLNPRLTVIDLLTEGMLVHGLISRAQTREAAQRLLGEVGLDNDALHRFPHEFSGGQRQRISIARALALQPELVVCDEAVSALDVSVRAQVLNLLLSLRARHNLAYLFISHDIAVVRHIAHRVAVMYLGVIMEEGAAGSVLDRPLHPYTRALRSAVPEPFAEQKQRMVLNGDAPSPAHPPPGCRFHPRCPWAAPACRIQAPVLENTDDPGDPIHRVACLRWREIQDL